MANYSTNEFKGGLKIMLDGQPHTITENELVKPGKGQAFSRVRVRNLKTGRTIDKTFKSGESVEAADVMEIDLQYLYSDGEFWHFMNSTTFEQLGADAAVVGDSKLWLKEEDICQVTFYPVEAFLPPVVQIRSLGQVSESHACSECVAYERRRHRRSDMNRRLHAQRDAQDEVFFHKCYPGRPGPNNKNKMETSIFVFPSTC